MCALITGGTGFIGSELIKRIAEPVVVSRNVEHARQKLPGVEAHRWDPLAGPPPAAALEGVEVVFNLAGDPVGEGRWTAEKKRRLMDSRVIGTENLIRGLESAGRRPPLLVSASAVGFYGSRGDEVLDESSAAGSGFLADICRRWEEASAGAKALGLRVVNPRIGIVLGHGGALAKMLTLFRFGVGGRLGSGRQWMPWIHVDDVVGLLLHAVSHTEINGPMNATAPHPVTNTDFTRTLAAVLHRPAILPARSLGCDYCSANSSTCCWVRNASCRGWLSGPVMCFSIPTCRRRWNRSCMRKLWQGAANRHRLGNKHGGTEVTEDSSMGVLPNDLFVNMSPSNYRLERTEFIPRPVPEVFRFFSDAKNLEAITPAFLHFQVITSGSIQIQAGTRIEYRLRLFDIPFGWQTRIETFDQDRSFTDIQLRGPYRRWHHRHEFHAAPGGTEMLDQVNYELPLGPLGTIGHVVFVRRTLERIFNYRRDQIAGLFP